uniref:COesterase domain-containing protein n=1 Tax=Elaeophora elaphi TaxID=1147741 RepID=A0A0R3RL68_9BILA
MIKTGRQMITKQGVIEGVRLVNDGNCQIDAFLGIPFAKLPIGSLRFKKPEPSEPWKGENGFAVLVFVHGGGFLIDCAAQYGDTNICNNLCRRDIIVVTIQYRLGLLGFFCTDDEICPDNNGLRNQLMAPQWENISAFRGNPERITLFSQSAGDLFQQVIDVSGNAECDWAVAVNERIVDVCQRFARKVGWKKDGKAKVFEGSIFNRKWINESRTRVILAPVIDGDFLPKSIEELRKEEPVKKCMTGTCKYESLFFGKN